jgi:hypothetical protein
VKNWRASDLFTNGDTVTMKPETLNAWLMDRELGELSPEAAELLEAYLVAVPAARSEADAVARTVCTARETVRRFPELAPVIESASAFRVGPIRFLFNPWMARAAALIAVASLCTWLGYRAGISETPANKRIIAGTARPPHVAARVAETPFDGLWTQYQVGYDGHRKAFTVLKQR